ncbi:hypothetical protein C7B64_21765 [Merismopedia glauca CCAP 1448/3]|uniref:Uncharacterized protein n=1 Tax=Merismopedia glauca CCAP 1448/3 TaxID=1296344 RepID=A0A2T1BXN9_9CYAN|nr:hypothetical protein C7B64_21765 [Merismopedia glauca CCAP 1448/3]
MTRKLKPGGRLVRDPDAYVMQILVRAQRVAPVQKSEVKIGRDRGERKPNQQSTINNSYFKSAIPHIF